MARSLGQHSQDNFGEDFITRFLRYAAEESLKSIFGQTVIDHVLMVSE